MARVSIISLLPDITKLSKFQREEYAKLWFDLAKLSVASFIIKIFEPDSTLLTQRSLVTAFAGLISFLLCVRIGLYISKEKV